MWESLMMRIEKQYLMSQTLSSCSDRLLVLNGRTENDIVCIDHAKASDAVSHEKLLFNFFISRRSEEAYKLK